MPIASDTRSELYVRYYDKVFGYVLNRVHSRADAEDITSDIFLKLLSRPEPPDPDRPGASTYVFRTMQTVLADFGRRKRTVFVPLEDVAERAEEQDDLQEQLELLSTALDALSEREQAVVILHYYHGLDHRQVAKKMDLSYVNVRQICHTALKKLRQKMNEKE